MILFIEDNMQITSVSFLKSVAKVKDCPSETFPEVAVIGRSNVGKSSLINMLLWQNIAKASDKPWKTQLINYFLVNKSWYFVDLPWYWYAKSSLESRRNWIDETHNYFLKRKPLVLLLVDWSIAPQKIDLEFMESLEEDELDFAIIMTKIDKANQKTVSQNLKSLKQQVQKTISYLPDIIMSSSVKKSWKEAVLDLIEKFL